MTGTEGNFLFDNIDPQEYTLTFTKDDYVSQTQKVSVKAGTASNVQISMEPITPVSYTHLSAALPRAFLL